jgi:hypothetical protein
MTDHTRHPPSPPEPEEELSAYLAGDLDEAEAAALEARLHTDEGLRARLEALHAALVALGGLDEVPVPEGFSQRLEGRIAAESAAADLEAARSRRAARRSRWTQTITAAAGVVVLSIAGLQVLSRDALEPGQDVAFDVAEEADDAAGSMALESAELDEATLEQEAASSPSIAAGAAGPERPESDAMRATADEAEAGPVIVDSGVELAGEDELRARYRGLPEIERLQGLALDEARERAVRHAEAVRQAPAFAGGVRPDACLDGVLADAAPRVVARVESVSWRGEAAIVYAVVTASERAQRLDRVELTVTTPDCEVLARTQA